MKKVLILAGFASWVLASAGVCHAVDVKSELRSGADHSTTATIDSTSKGLRITEYNPDGGLENPAARATYTASTAAFTPAATPTDILTIAGSATKTIKITKIQIGATQTTPGINAFYIVKRSAADTSGTSVALTKVPNDSQNAAASATVLQYTANPTPGAGVGNVWIGYVDAPAPATVGIGADMYCIDFSKMFGQPIVLRGTAEQLAVNFNGAALPSGLSLAIVVTWTEE